MCNRLEMSTFHVLQDVPIHSVLLMSTRDKALLYPRGDIRLGYCTSCGFITNYAFMPDRLEYSPQYE